MRAMQCSTCKNDMSNKRINRSVIIKKKSIVSVSNLEKKSTSTERAVGGVGGYQSNDEVFGYVAIHYKVMTMQKAKRRCWCTQVYDRKTRNVSRTVWTDDDDDDGWEWM